MTTPLTVAEFVGILDFLADPMHADDDASFDAAIDKYGAPTLAAWCDYGELHRDEVRAALFEKPAADRELRAKTRALREHADADQQRAIRATLAELSALVAKPVSLCEAEASRRVAAEVRAVRSHPLRRAAFHEGFGHTLVSIAKGAPVCDMLVREDGSGLARCLDDHLPPYDLAVIDVAGATAEVLCGLSRDVESALQGDDRRDFERHIGEHTGEPFDWNCYAASEARWEAWRIIESRMVAGFRLTARALQTVGVPVSSEECHRIFDATPSDADIAERAAT